MSLYQTFLFCSIFTLSVGILFAYSTKEVVLRFSFQLIHPSCSVLSVSFLGVAYFLHSKGQVSKILGQYTIVPLLPLLLVGSVPKHHFCLSFSAGAATFSVIWYYIISISQTFSTYSAAFSNPFQLRHLACFQQDNVPHCLLELV